MLCIMLAAILLGTLPYILISNAREDVIEDNRFDREQLANVLPPKLVRENVQNFEMQILCDIGASETIAAASGFENSLSEKALKRNEHLTVETGAVIAVTMAADFVQMAREDILSGARRYNLYAADAATSLSPLLSAGQLADVSHSLHIRPEKAWFDGNIMQKLSVFGGQYLISSAAADARSSAEAVVYNRAIADRIGFAASGEGSLATAALDGKFTLEVMRTASRAAAAIEEQDALLTGEGVFHPYNGFCYGEEDVFPLYFGVGGGFVLSEGDSLSVIPLSGMRTALGAVMQLTDDISVVADDTAFASGNTLFSVYKLSEIADLREKTGEIGILPLPKANADAEYHNYIDLANTTMLAIPAGTEEQNKVEYLVSRMAFLSYGYIEPLLKEQIAADYADDEKILNLIAESVSCDLSSLFGYGDIDGLVAKLFCEGDGRLALEYYNRKTLYEKVFSILEKRLHIVTE